MQSRVLRAIAQAVLEKRLNCRGIVQRKTGSNVLVWTHNDCAPERTIDAEVIKGVQGIRLRTK